MGPTDDGQFELTADILVIDGDYITWGAGNFEPGGQYFLREIDSTGNDIGTSFFDIPNGITLFTGGGESLIKPSNELGKAGSAAYRLLV